MTTIIIDSEPQYLEVGPPGVFVPLAEVDALAAERDSLRAKVAWLESSCDILTAANRELTLGCNLAGEDVGKLEAERDGLRALVVEVADYVRETSWNIGPLNKLTRYIDNKDKEQAIK